MMRKILILLLLPLLGSSTVHKSCLRQIAIDHVGQEYDNIIGNIIFSTQPVKIGNRDFISTTTLVLSEEEFSFLEAEIKRFDQIVPAHEQQESAELGTFRVEMQDSCKLNRTRFLNRLQSITFLQYLLKVSGQFNPGLRNKIAKNTTILPLIDGLRY